MSHLILSWPLGSLHIIIFLLGFIYISWLYGWVFAFFNKEESILEIHYLTPRKLW